MKVHRFEFTDTHATWITAEPLCHGAKPTEWRESFSRDSIHKIEYRVIEADPRHPGSDKTALKIMDTFGETQMIMLTAPELKQFEDWFTQRGDYGAEAFDNAWKRMEARGYQYSAPSLSLVKFGWDLAKGKDPT